MNLRRCGCAILFDTLTFSPPEHGDNPPIGGMLLRVFKKKLLHKTVGKKCPQKGL